MRRNFLLFAAAVTVVGVLSVHADPPPLADITWDTVHTISGDTDVSTSGTLAYAYHFTAGSTDTTVNGVTFTAFTVTGASPLTEGNATLFNAGVTTTGSGSAPYSSLSSSYQALLNEAATHASAMTIALGGLVNGHTYQLEVWCEYSSSSAGGIVTRTTFAGASNNAVLDADLTRTNGGLGQYVTGQFTGTVDGSASIDINPGTITGVFNAFQLRDLTVVPEPSTWALLGLGAGAMMFFRRRRNQTANTRA